MLADGGEAIRDLTAPTGHLTDETASPGGTPPGLHSGTITIEWLDNQPRGPDRRASP